MNIPRCLIHAGAKTGKQVKSKNWKDCIILDDFSMKMVGTEQYINSRIRDD